MAAERSMTGRVVGVLALVALFVSLLTVGGLRGCEELVVAEDDADHQRVRIDGRTYRLELALTQEKRVKGLSGRTEIPENGGMLFVFPRHQVQVQSFVMRDCPIDIDIIYLDPSGRVVAKHQMKAEPPRGPGEGHPDDPQPNMAYENRLKKYSSRYPAQFVIEIKGGTLPELKLEEGDKIELPLEELKRRAR